MTPNLPHSEIILRRSDVQARTGLSRSTIYEFMRTGKFPGAINLGPKSVGWLQSEIEAWIADRVQKSRAGAAYTGWGHHA